MKSIDKSWKQLIKEQIEYCADECSADNWDGDGGFAIAPASKEAALLFIDLLPEEMVAPDVGPENAGHFSFDWNPCDGSVISVSVLPGRAIFASIMGSEKLHGVESIDKMPKIVQDLVQRMEQK